MKQPRNRISQTIADKTFKGGSAQELSREIAAYLLSERRVQDLDSIMRDVQGEWADRGRVEVIAESAYALTTDIRRDIEREVKKVYPDAKEIVISDVINPEVIGGVRLNLPDQQLDLSIEAKLNKFKQLTASTGKD